MEKSTLGTGTDGTAVAASLCDQLRDTASGFPKPLSPESSRSDRACFGSHFENPIAALSAKGESRDRPSEDRPRRTAAEEEEYERKEEPWRPKTA